MPGKSIIEALERLKACPEAVLWARPYSELEQLWYQCPHIEWLLWTLEQIDYSESRKLRLFSVACAKHYGAFLVDIRCRKAIDVAEAFALGVTGAEHLRAARNGARIAIAETINAPSWTPVIAAAANASYHTTRSSPMEAAKGASSYALRAADWDQSPFVTREAEEAWQLGELRGLLSEDLQQGIELTQRRIQDLEESRS